MFYVDLNNESETSSTKDEDKSKTSDTNGARFFTEDSSMVLKAPALLLKTNNHNNKSATLKSNCTLEDYNTPPESPGVMGSADDLSEELSPLPSLSMAPPVPPPRPKRDKKAAANLKSLQISPEPHQLLESAAEDLLKISGDLKDLCELRSPKINSGISRKPDDDLKGYLHMLVVSAKGLRQITKTRWFVYDKKGGSLKYYKSEKDEQSGQEPIGEIGIASATFFYEVESDTNGEFTVCTKSGEHLLSAGNPEKRMYWLQQLQRARREFSSTRGPCNRNSNVHQVGLLCSPQDERSKGLSSSCYGTFDEEAEGMDEQGSGLKDASPFKDVMPSLERPPDMYTSPPKSADYYSTKKSSFFGGGLGLISRVGKPNFRLPRSSSMRTPSPPATGAKVSGMGVMTPGGRMSPPPYNKPLGVSSTPGSFQALTKLRKSLRDKKSSSSAGLVTCSSPSSGTSPSKIGSKFGNHAPPLKGSSCFGTSREELNAREDELQALRDEAQASKEVIVILRKQIEELQREKDTLTELQKPDMDDGQLLEILRGKDTQIVELENQTREQTKECDLKEQQIQKLLEELKTYKDFLEAKDESLVRLTNQLHETELSNVMLAATVNNLTSQASGHLTVGTPGTGGQPPTTPLGLPPKHPSLMRLHSNSNGISFDSDKGEFKEFVDVGSQTNEGTHQSGAEIMVSRHRLRSHSESGNSSMDEKEIERLQDMVTAYEMQNKFLNKEVLELNQLRQQANDREQKLFIESSEWEAKFYQIQSKYLLLLNELHNPQVGVSASRQEMVTQLMKDIVEAAGEKPNLNTSSDTYDRFGFRLNDGDDEESSLEEKAEKLWKQAQDQHQNATEVAENRESLWEDAIHALNSSRTAFQMTSDIKNLLRQGIPITQRGAVWKAIVDHKLMRAQNEKFQADYYKKLLANYNPTRKLTPAAKQIELDLLRTLPNNKHYDRPHADGIAKLRRVLLAYSLHNPDVEYCQGFNRIAAIALLFMHEEDAFWTLVYIVEHLMPAEYFSRDKQLIGAQVDQEVLKEVLREKLPRLSGHFENHGVDPSLFTLNWFLCVYVDTLPVKTYLHIWDAFLFEGNKVLMRYAIAIFKYMEELLLKQTDYMSIVNTLRDRLESCYDISTLTQIAFYELNPFPLRNITNKREHHTKLLEAQKRELDHIRQNYRKNSLARSNAKNNICPDPNGESNPESGMFQKCYVAPRTERLSSQPEMDDEDDE